MPIQVASSYCQPKILAADVSRRLEPRIGGEISVGLEGRTVSYMYAISQLPSIGCCHPLHLLLPEYPSVFKLIMAGDWVCESDRASDYYGLGVRLGIYFAWLQAWTANAILPSQISGALATNTVFLMTLLVAMVNDSNTGALSRLDGLLLMHLCGGTVFGVLSLWGYRTRLYTQHGRGAIQLFGGYGTHIRMATALAVSLYGLWYWSWGVKYGLFALGPDDGMDPPNPSECSKLYTFFFAKLDAAGPIRYYYIVVSASCAAYFGAMLIVSILAGWFSVERLAGTLHKRWSRAADVDKLSRPVYITGFHEREYVLHTNEQMYEQHH